MPQRVLPETVKIPLSGIVRMLLPSRHVPPYAIEIFGTVLDIEEDEGPAWNQVLVVECDRPKGISRFPFNTEGFVVTPNTGPERDMERLEGYIEIGYLLGKVSLTDMELTQMVDNPVLSSI